MLALPFIAVAMLWPKLPEHIPTHWGWNGKVDGWSNRGFGLFLLPILNVAIYILLTYLPKFDPRMRRDGFRTLGNLAALGIARLMITAFLTFLFALQLVAAFNPRVNSGIILVNGFLVMFLVMGNFFGNLQPNHFVGIRTPWTLKSDETWRVTHRLAGRLMVFGSLGFLCAQFFISNIAPLAFGAVLVLAAWSLLFSWWHFHRTKQPNKI